MFNTVKLRSKAEEAALDLPETLALAEELASSVIHGAHARLKAGSGENFWQFRDYAEHDRPQDIDWRQSAKGSRVFVKEREWQTAQTSIFWCKADAGMRWRSDPALASKYERSCIFALALSFLLHKAGEKTALYGCMKAGSTEKTMQDMARHMTAPDTALTHTLPHFINHPFPTNASLTMISDFLEPIETIEKTFKDCRARIGGGLVIQILDPAELELPYEGHVRFKDMAGSQSIAIKQVSAIRKEYKSRISAHCKALEELCRDYHLGYILHRTDHEPKNDMQQIWMLKSALREQNTAQGGVR